MLDIKYIGSPGKNACALACYTMTASYFFPDLSLDDVTKIAGGKPGYVVWAFKFWLWILNRGIKIEIYSLFDYQDFAERGVDSWKEKLSQREAEFYISKTYDIDELRDDIKKVLNHKNFVHHHQKPTFEKLKKAFESGKVCEVTLNPRKLDHREGFSLHRVVVIDVGDDFVIIHDPRRDNHMPNRKVDKNLFLQSWLEDLKVPGLSIYHK